MKYFKTEILYVDDEKVYGSLPENFVTAYEKDGFAYFPIHELLIKNNNAIFDSLEEITEQTYTTIINELNADESQKREDEFQKFLEEVSKKKEEEQLNAQRIADLEMAITEILMS